MLLYGINTFFQPVSQRSQLFFRVKIMLAILHSIDSSRILFCKSREFVPRSHIVIRPVENAGWYISCGDWMSFYITIVIPVEHYADRQYNFLFLSQR